MISDTTTVQGIQTSHLCQSASFILQKIHPTEEDVCVVHVEGEEGRGKREKEGRGRREGRGEGRREEGRGRGGEKGGEGRREEGGENVQHEINQNNLINYASKQFPWQPVVSYLVLQVSLLVLVQVTERENSKKMNHHTDQSQPDERKSCLPDASPCQHKTCTGSHNVEIHFQHS